MYSSFGLGDRCKDFVSAMERSVEDPMLATFIRVRPKYNVYFHPIKNSNYNSTSEFTM